jgi:hypothetical protein
MRDEEEEALGVGDAQTRGGRRTAGRRADTRKEKTRKKRR